MTLLDLPTELLDQIIHSLAEAEPPSERYLHQEPSAALFHSNQTPLKYLSSTCTRLRRLSFSALFARLKVEDTVQHAQKLLRFVDRHGIKAEVKTILIYNADWYQRNRFPATREAVKLILGMLNPAIMTLVLPPVYIAELLIVKIEMNAAWAFNMHLQVLQLEQSPTDTQTALDSHSGRLAQGTVPILRSRAWTRMTFNEGSWIPAYNHYEYFHLRAPSIMNPKDLESSPSRTLNFLTSFDYIAVFPCNGLRRFCHIMGQLKNLKTLRTQFARVSDMPTSMETKFHYDPKDLWHELDKDYETMCDFLGDSALPSRNSSLKEFVVLDYACEGLRSTLDDIMDGNPSLIAWKHDGEGRWLRQA